MQNFLPTISSIPSLIFCLVLGLICLIGGANLFVSGSSKIATKFKIPPMIIGLTIVAMGTSLPETAVSATAALAGQNSLAISNVLGSNIFNLIVAIGMCALIRPILVKKEVTSRDIPFSLFVTILLIVLGVIGHGLNRVDGIILLVIFAFYLRSLVKQANVNKPADDKNETIISENNANTKEKILSSIFVCILFIVIGIIAIVYGGEAVIYSCKTIALNFGMSETLIGLTIVSIGTSLPELVTSVVAACKGEVDMALGNAIGSNIFNVLMVLGLSATISPMGFEAFNLIDSITLVALTIITSIFCKTEDHLSRKEGAFMLIIYVAFMFYICNR